jgi:Uma2 family endonuclease
MRYDARLEPMTVDDYLRWEAGNAIKHEYVAGRVYAMTGVTTRHNRIMLNLAIALRQRVKRRGCEVFVAEVRLKAAEDRYYYPDVMVACGPAADVDLIVSDPSLVAEVTSKATRRNDHHEKLDAYKRKASLRFYLIADQRRKHVVVVSRAPSGDWEQNEIAEGEIPLDYFGCTLPIDEIYDGVKLPPLSVREEDEIEGWEDEEE